METIARHVIVTATGGAADLSFETLFQADARRVRGWVRRLPGRRVEAHLEGPAASVEGLLAWMHRGPEGTTVLAVEITRREPEGLSEFSLDRSKALVG